MNTRQRHEPLNTFSQVNTVLDDSAPIQGRITFQQSPKRQIEMIQSLRQQGHKSQWAVPMLIEMLDDKSDQVRAQAISALAFVEKNPELVVPVFIVSLNDPSLCVRQYCTAALGLFSTDDLIKYDALSALEQALIEDDDALWEFGGPLVKSIKLKSL